MSVELSLMLMLQTLKMHVPLVRKHGLEREVNDVVWVIALEVTCTSEALHDLRAYCSADIYMQSLCL